MYLSLDGSGHGLREQLGGGAERAARHVVRHRPERARSIATRSARYFTTPVTRVTARSAPSRRNNRRFVHVRARRRRRARGSARRRRSRGRPIGSRRTATLFVYQQTVGPRGRRRAGAPDAQAGTGGRSSRSGCTCRARSCITTPARRICSAATSWRGNSRLTDRLRGAPLDARRADGDAVDSLPHAVAVRRHDRGGRR